ncbi:MAG TPA: sigma-70 family RNA polymerase sigma factor [Flavobacteriaceae bacterium]|nr:sigma-70 family RNA polymerase sigma factor [Flavobacteriaceae bacterium]MCB9213689.1 sigma-70 family RNA polymerase sigma factor [Alteromonas sp.]HPF12191.1 sigma-70 family RNA polymerase sigma factor [Flavobacteriaceae bacterium]HQU22324.1 sigma-70 family RNA polymerase sigma factor [Flavobacteriaceae bacterium]HQU66177.1 sigma-70 family RNA polymerase sigma factor [Flavobacteriaceae bacterium]
MTTTTDHDIIEATLGGNVQAFSTLVARYQDFVFTIAVRVLNHREEAEEVAQDSFIKAFEALSSYRKEAKFSSWLYSIVYRKALDRLRKNKKARTLDFVEDLTEGDETQAVNGLEQLELQERNAMIQEALEQLPESDAAIVSFYYYENQSVKEIAEITGLTEDNIKIKLHRSRKKLFSLLKHYVLPEHHNHNGRAI